ncbi:thioredoxin domain-containing protein [uncultured Algimonas sp.]|uniref:DsbA family protein n=1 Tax=uncultured Algimonas sp. TaxID=1547920 RepID=UPI002633F7A6|nr:thioredoxin domain-containing protein [uncultured Algimonas sp.]
MASVIRTLSLVGAAALFAACNNAGQDGTASSATPAGASADRTAFERSDDHAIGRVDAPVTIVEYASVTCPACALWHRNVYPDLKARYIDTGKVRYVFREFLTGQPDLAEAGFKIALCADEEDYFTNIKLQFDRLQQIMQMAQNGDARTAYINIAKASGLSEEEFATCMANEAHRETIQSKMQQGFDEGVGGTPAFFINGNAAKIGTVEQLDEVLGELLGDEAPAPSDNTTE